MGNIQRLALIGAGAFSDFCLGSYQTYLPGVTAVAVFDHNRAAAEAFAARHNIEQVTQSVEALVATDCEAVVILTPPNTHYELGKLALAAGKNVLIEKPIAFTSEQARELVALATKNGVRFTANLVLRHHPFHQQLRQAVKDKTYGALQAIKTTARLAEYPADHWYWQPKISGGFFLNTYTHFFDLYHFIGAEPVSAAGHRGSAESGEIIKLTFPSFAAELDINLHASNADERVETEYHFERAVIKTEGWLPDRLTTTVNSQTEAVTDKLPKLERYQRILAAILSELVAPDGQPIISQDDLAEAVRVALLCQTTELT